MRNVSNAFRDALAEDKRNYICNAVITLTDNTVLTITNAEIWQDGLSTNENVSDESTFGALGGVVVNSGTLIINNIDESYSEYDFTGAVVSINVGLLIGTSVEYVKMGTFTVDEAQYNGALITLNCLDNMAKFDKPYSESTLVYPATLGTIVSDACTNCGVTLATPTFPNYNFQIDTRPTDTNITFREIISYAAIIAGCFAKCNNNGGLELKWFDTDALQDEESEFDIDTPTDVDSVHHITSLSSQDFSVDPVIITGIKLTVDSTVNAELTTVDHLYGTDGYLIKIEKNPFITETNVDAIGNYLSTNLVGLTFRKANITHLNDPSIEAGDVALVIDRKGNVYPILITNTTFNVSSYQTTICAADTPVRNSATRYSAITKSQAAAQALVKQEKTLREAMGANLTQALNAKPGMYETRVQEAGGGYTYYMHDKPNLNESTAVIKITNEGVGITPNYQATPTTWYGLTVDGTFIANIMSVIGIDFDWGTGGSLVLGGNNNVNGTLTIKNAQNQTIGSWNNNGITANKGTIGGWNIGATSGTGELNGSLYYGTFGAANSIYLIPAGSTTSKAIAGRTGTDWVVTAGANWGVTKTGSMYASAGTIGPWTIGSSGIYNGKSTAHLDGTNGVFLGTSGLAGETAHGGFVLSDYGQMMLMNKDTQNASLVVTNESNTLLSYIGIGSICVGDPTGIYISWWRTGEGDFGAHRDPHIDIGGTWVGGNGVLLGLNNGTDGLWIDGKNTDADSITFLNGTSADIKYGNSYATISMIRFLPASDAYGHGISIGGGGATIIGGGESATACQSLLSTYGDERMIIANDGAIDFYANCQNGANAANIMTLHAGSLTIRNNNLTKGTNPSAETNRAIVFTDKDGYSTTANDVLSVWYGGGVGANGNAYSIIRQYKYASNNSDYAQITVMYPASGSPYVSTTCQFEASGHIFSTVSSGGTAIVQARNSNVGNRIYIWANSSDGTVGLSSVGANNTGYDILARSNNSNNITAYGVWSFTNGSVYILNNYELVLKAASGSTDAGDLVFQNGSGTEIGRIWSVGTGGLNFRTSSSSGTVLQILAGGLYTPANIHVGSGKTQAYSQVGTWLGVNGNITCVYDSTSGQGGGIYFGYKGTNGYNVGLYHKTSGTIAITGNLSVDGGSITALKASGEANVIASNGTNKIYLWTNSNGTVGIYSYSADGNGRAILARANNSHAITAYGAWTFDGTLACKNYAGNAGRPVTSASTEGKQVSAFECVNSTTLHVSGHWGGTTFAWRNATVSTSDIRLKTNINDCTVTALPLINAIKMRAFDWKEDGRHQRIGFIADELEKLDSKLAIGGGYDADGSMDIKSVDTFYLIGYLVKAVQELSAEVNRLKRH